MRDIQAVVAVVAVAIALLLMAYFAASVLIFRLRHPDLVTPKDPSPREHSFLLHYLFRQWWYHWATPLVRFLVEKRWHPNLLTYLSLIFAAMSAILFAAGQVVFGGLFLLFSGACDSLDGRLARQRALNSPRGAFLDSSIDRMSEILVFIGLGAYLRESPFLYAAFLGLGASLMVSYARARGQSLGVDFNRGPMQRAERIVYLGAAALLDPIVQHLVDLGPLREIGGILGVTLAFVAILSTVTAVYRVVAIARMLDGSRGDV